MTGGSGENGTRGFPKDHDAIELLRYKQYWFECSFTDQEALAADFLNKMNQTYKVIRPFFDYTRIAVSLPILMENRFLIDKEKNLLLPTKITNLKSLKMDILAR